MNYLSSIISAFILLLSVLSCDEADMIMNLDCMDTNSTYLIDLDASGCNQTTGLTPSFSMTENPGTDTRTFTTNNIPGHLTGSFPNPGNPNTISEQNNTLTVDLTPALASDITSIINSSTGWPQYEFGIILSGITIDPAAAEYWRNTSNNQLDFNWNYEALSSGIDLGTDCNNAHVQPSGEYHYHGTPSAYLEGLNVDGSQMVMIGYAADGFPIYYKYGYIDAGNAASGLMALIPGYRLKEKERGGDGISTPDGCPDGTFVQDYEYLASVGDLDECNGRTGVTPEYPHGTYYYVITDAWPSTPRCFVGSPNSSFGI